jgi:hypothetical protein
VHRHVAEERALPAAEAVEGPRRVLVNVAGRRRYRASDLARPRSDRASPCCSLRSLLGAQPFAEPSAVPSGERQPAGGRALLG